MSTPGRWRQVLGLGGALPAPPLASRGTKAWRCCPRPGCATSNNDISLKKKNTDLVIFCFQFGQGERQGQGPRSTGDVQGRAVLSVRRGQVTGTLVQPPALQALLPRGHRRAWGKGPAPGKLGGTSAGGRGRRFQLTPRHTQGSSPHCSSATLGK